MIFNTKCKNNHDFIRMFLLYVYKNILNIHPHPHFHFRLNCILFQIASTNSPVIFLNNFAKPYKLLNFVQLKKKKYKKDRIHFTQTSCYMLRFTIFPLFYCRLLILLHLSNFTNKQVCHSMILGIKFYCVFVFNLSFVLSVVSL